MSSREKKFLQYEIRNERNYLTLHRMHALNVAGAQKCLQCGEPLHRIAKPVSVDLTSRQMPSGYEKSKLAPQQYTVFVQLLALPAACVTHK
jgi:hypothetical protein